jgi:ElaB/YqjD/DUF883 family membrane-anchored ribosome-binding protein
VEHRQLSASEEAAEEIRTQTEQALQSMRKSLEHAMDSVRHSTREAARYADRHVSDNPWSSVGVAFGAGMVFGVLLTLAAGMQRGASRHL